MSKRLILESLYRIFFFVKVGMIPKFNSPTKLLYYHLCYSQSKTNTILIDIIFDIKFIKHLSNIIRIF